MPLKIIEGLSKWWTAAQFIIGVVLIEAFGDYQLAKFANESSQAGLILGYGSYAALLVLFIKSIQTMGLAWSNSAWDGWSNITTGLVAIFALGERPTSHQLCGMALISTGLFLLGSESTGA